MIGLPHPGRVRALLILALAFVAWEVGATGSGPGARAEEAPAFPDFKLAIAFHGVREEPITTAELLVRGGIAYRFASEAPGEILILDPAAARLELVDIRRRIRSEIFLTRLDEKQAMLHKAIAGAIRDHEATGSRSDRLAAEMSRALIDPKLDETYDPATHHLRLTNPVVTVDAVGEPDPGPEAGPSRLSLIDGALAASFKLEAVRDPESIPPFIRLEALRALTARHHLRPTAMTFVYRLAGPPRKHGWTYRLVESLTVREIEALNRVIKFRERTPYVPFHQYEDRTRKKTK